MNSSFTPIQLNYPIPEDFVVLAKRFCPNAIDILLGFVWQGFDKLADGNFDVSKDDQNLEDDITYAAFCRIHDTISPFSPFQVIHQPLEPEKRKIAGPPPKSDLGFRLRGGNIRSHFTIEAKIIRTESSISKYVKEITGNFLTRRYSTFSNEAAMLGYLLSGHPEITFNAISASLNCKLYQYPAFPKRTHRYSDHHRIKNEIDEISSFRCHHMIIIFSKAY